MVTNYKDFIAWQRSFELVLDVYHLTTQLPKHELFGLGSQMQRSAVSIPSNIAEGFRRRSNKEFIRFLNIALGSCSELETQLQIAVQVYPAADSSDLLTKVDEVGRLLNKLTSSLRPQ